MNWRTDFDWTDLSDSPVSWSELEKELEGKRVKVEFMNRGVGTPDGVREVRVIETQLCERTHAPELIIENPWRSGDTLVCIWERDHWVCDLD